MNKTFTDDPVDLLLVDDRAEDLLTLTHVLAGPEYRLTTASSGPEALKRPVPTQSVTVPCRYACVLRGPVTRTLMR